MTHQITGKERTTPIAQLSDEEWENIRPLLATYDPPRRKGRKRVDPRGVLEAVIYRHRSGCPWNALPEEYPDDSTVHRAFQRWKQAGVFERLWADLIERFEDLDGVDWEWQAADGAMGKARLGGTSWAPTPRIGAGPA